MNGIDRSLEFRPLRIAVLTVSDTRDEATDSSGDILAEAVTSAGHVLAGRVIVRDVIAEIRDTASGWIAGGKVDVIISTGGTGLTGRDVTPEAFASLYDREMTGFSVAFQRVSVESVGLSVMLSRASAGVSGRVVLFALPGSNGAVRDGWHKIIAPIIDSRHRPCNLADLVPRLDERPVGCG